MTSPSHDAKELRKEAIEHVRERAQRELEDTSLDGWRTPRRRRWVVAGWLATVALLVALAWLGQTIAVGLALLGTIAASWLLRRVVRGMADLPEELLDERMEAARNLAYRWAYIILVAVLSVVLVTGWMLADARTLNWSPSADHVQALLWLVTGLAMGLPSAVVAVREGEI